MLNPHCPKSYSTSCCGLPGTTIILWVKWMQAALPVALRRDRPMTPIEDGYFRISKVGREALADIPSRSYRQRDLLQVLIDAGSEGLSREELK